MCENKETNWFLHTANAMYNLESLKLRLVSLCIIACLKEKKWNQGVRLAAQFHFIFANFLMISISITFLLLSFTISVDFTINIGKILLFIENLCAHVVSTTYIRKGHTQVNKQPVNKTVQMTSYNLAVISDHKGFHRNLYDQMHICGQAHAMPRNNSTITNNALLVSCMIHNG